MNSNKKLAAKLEQHVSELCLPIGRRVGSPGHSEAEKWIEKRLKDAGCAPYRGKHFALPYQIHGFGFTNFAGIIRGEDPALPPILIGAHYDSVIDGACADDNGAAVAATIEAAKYIDKIGGLKRDLIVALFDAEEPPFFQTDCMGSIRFYEDQIDERGIHFALISDLIGHDVRLPADISKTIPCSNIITSPFAPLTFMTGAESHPDLPSILSGISQPRGMKVIATLNSYIGDMSDHGIFRQNNIPYVFLSCGRWEHYHQSTDTPDRLNYRKLSAITKYCIQICIAASENSLAESGRVNDSLEFEKETWRDSLGILRLPLAKLLGITDFDTRSNINKAARKLTSLGL